MPVKTKTPEIAPFYQLSGRLWEVILNNEENGKITLADASHDLGSFDVPTRTLDRGTLHRAYHPVWPTLEETGLA